MKFLATIKILCFEIVGEIDLLVHFFIFIVKVFCLAGTMQTRGRNRLVIEQLMDGQNYFRAQPYIEQLMDDQNYFEAQARDGQSNESNRSAGGNEIQHNEDSGNSEARKVRGPTLLKDI
ncbi:uncharacterized protein LOC107803178 isoform X4 [Nicotiana tabacum]|uniref:Uncharacterized protein LOC107803178 isoform X4 n=1 Tax=Nicotiana tabacum TaxID=4097 RepID=A0AC58UH09_TOBAC